MPFRRALKRNTRNGSRLLLCRAFSLPHEFPACLSAGFPARMVASRGACSQATDGFAVWRRILSSSSLLFLVGGSKWLITGARGRWGYLQASTAFAAAPGRSARLPRPREGTGASLRPRGRPVDMPSPLLSRSKRLKLWLLLAWLGSCKKRNNASNPRVSPVKPIKRGGYSQKVGSDFVKGRCDMPERFILFNFS